MTEDPRPPRHPDYAECGAPAPNGDGPCLFRAGHDPWHAPHSTVGFTGVRGDGDRMAYNITWATGDEHLCPEGQCPDDEGHEDLVDQYEALIDWLAVHPENVTPISRGVVVDPAVCGADSPVLDRRCIQLPDHDQLRHEAFGREGNSTWALMWLDDIEGHES